MHAGHCGSIAAWADMPETASILPGAVWEYHPDAAMESAWQRLVSAMDTLDVVGVDFETSAERELCARMVEAEQFLLSTPAKTPHGTAIQLWLVLHHTLDSEEHEELVRRRDLEALLADASVDGNGGRILATLRSLQAQMMIAVTAG